LRVDDESTTLNSQAKAVLMIARQEGRQVMGTQALAYAMQLQGVHPKEKYLAIILSNSHDETSGCILTTIDDVVLSSGLKTQEHARRALTHLEDQGLIRAVKPGENEYADWWFEQGGDERVAYRFVGLDDER
jgi:hypothetical protein